MLHGIYYILSTNKRKDLLFMNNVMKIVEMGMCTGCGICSCEHITFQTNVLGFPAPVVEDKCSHCGQCLAACIYNPVIEE